eukprot:gene5052-10115_t
MGKAPGGDWFNAVHHLSGACRAARSLQISDLAASTVLLYMRDFDVIRCKVYGGMQLGLLGMLLLGLANLIRAGGDRTGQSLLECVWTCVWSVFLLLNAAMLSVSPLLLATPYVLLVLFLIYYYVILKPQERDRNDGTDVTGRTPTEPLLLRMRSNESRIEWAVAAAATSTPNSEFTDNSNYPSYSHGSIFNTRLTSPSTSTSISVNSTPSRRFQKTRSEFKRKVLQPTKSEMSHSTTHKWLVERYIIENTKNKYEEALKVFLDFDLDGNGYLDVNDLESFVITYWKNLKPEYATWTIDEMNERLDKIMCALDPNHTEKVFYDTFKDWFVCFKEEIFIPNNLIDIDNMLNKRINYVQKGYDEDFEYENENAAERDRKIQSNRFMKLGVNEIYSDSAKKFSTSASQNSPISDAQYGTNNNNTNNSHAEGEVRSSSDNLSVYSTSGQQSPLEITNTISTSTTHATLTEAEIVLNKHENNTEKNPIPSNPVTVPVPVSVTAPVKQLHEMPSLWMRELIRGKQDKSVFNYWASTPSSTSTSNINESEKAEISTLSNINNKAEINDNNKT